jgi:hypothetical protein
MKRSARIISLVTALGLTTAMVPQSSSQAPPPTQPPPEFAPPQQTQPRPQKDTHESFWRWRKLDRDTPGEHASTIASQPGEAGRTAGQAGGRKPMTQKRKSKNKDQKTAQHP